LYSKTPFADSNTASRLPVGSLAFGIKPVGGYAAEMGIRDIEAVGMTRTNMARTCEKWLICRDCGFRPPIKLIGRKCRVCGGQMRVDRLKAE
jgi:hypothetical protein